MTDYEEQIATDFATLSHTELFDKYWCKIKNKPTVCGVADALERKDLLSGLIRSDWVNDGLDEDGLYLIKVGDHFQVFIGERGFKHGIKEFRNLKSACISWIDMAFNQLDHLAPDSKIR